MLVLFNRRQFTRAHFLLGVSHTYSGPAASEPPFPLASQVSQAQEKCGPSWRKTSWTTSPLTCRRSTARTISLRKRMFSTKSVLTPALTCPLCSRTSGTPSLLRDPSPFTRRGQGLTCGSALFLLVQLAYLIILTKN